MLIVRLSRWTLLDRQVGSSGKHGIWSFHCAESTSLRLRLSYCAMRPFCRRNPRMDKR